VFVVVLFIRLKGEPRHEFDCWEVASEREEEFHGVVLSSIQKKKMRMNSSRSFQRKGMARVGLVLGRCCWAAGGLQRGLSGQVRQVSLFSIFFSVFISPFVYFLF
jgi:hypothetical protein